MQSYFKIVRRKESYLKCSHDFKTFSPAGLEGINIHIASQVLDLLSMHKQNASRNESGGMLFATINNNDIYISVATVPSREDRSHRFGISMNKNGMQAKINEFYYKHSLHYVGDWHTHPEIKPSPSSQDLSTAKGFLSRQSSLNYFIMIIVSCDSFDKSYFGLCSRNKEYRLNAMP